MLSYHFNVYQRNDNLDNMTLALLLLQVAPAAPLNCLKESKVQMSYHFHLASIDMMVPSPPNLTF